MARYAMLIDLTRCIGCDACTVACKQENGTPLDTFFARVINIEAGSYPNVKRIYLPVLCNHCDDAPCLKACPNKAIFRRADGIVLIDQDRCRGTGACVSACPYGNVYLQKVDRWYLNEDEPYERDFVKPRLRENVARKCTYCAHRVDEGLDPACVVACPTTARIFGDLEDTSSKVSRYISEQSKETNRHPFHLLPEAKTKPATCYLGTLSSQTNSTLGGRAEPMASTGDAMKSTVSEAVSSLGKTMAFLLAMFLSIFAASTAFAQEGAAGGTDHYSTSSCVGCHGTTGMGGVGPPVVNSPMTEEEFYQIVRKGKGMMPPTPESQLSDEEMTAIFQELKQMAWDEDAIPLAEKVGGLLSLRNLGIFFSVVTLISFIFGVKVLWYWVSNAGLPHMGKAIAKLGIFKSAWIVGKSLIVDGLLVASLWRRSKHRWLMHGTMLYGFTGLLIADILIAIYNPSRGRLDNFHFLELLPFISGLLVLSGVCYVMYRYKVDKYIDNGLTLGRDFLFVNLLFHTMFSGFFVWALNRSDAATWVQPIYIYHLFAVALLMVTAPFTRFQHAFVVPVMVALTRLTEAVTEAQSDVGFAREPSPGRHHKTQRIAEGVVKTLDPKFKDKVTIRYYP